MRFTTMALTAAVATGLLSAPVLAAEASIKLVSMLPKKTPIGQTFAGFIERFNKKFKGEIQIDWRGGSEVIPQFKQPNAVRLGSIDATLTSPSYVNGILNVSGAANYSNRDYEDIRKSGYHAEMERLHKAKGLVYVGELPTHATKFYIFLRKPITKLADFKGLKIRVFPAIAPAVKALGANPIVLPMTEMYTAMERGIIDGFSTGIAGVPKQFKGLVGAYVSPGFYRATFHFLANPRKWNALPEATRKKVIDFVRNEEPATYEASWLPMLKASYALAKETGIKEVKFSQDEQTQYLKLVNGAAWDAVKAKAPKEGAVLQKFLLQ